MHAHLGLVETDLETDFHFWTDPIHAIDATQAASTSAVATTGAPLGIQLYSHSTAADIPNSRPCVGIGGVYGNCDINFDHFSRSYQPLCHPTRAPCDVPYLVYMLIGC